MPEAERVGRRETAVWTTRGWAWGERALGVVPVGLLRGLQCCTLGGRKQHAIMLRCLGAWVGRGLIQRDNTVRGRVARSLGTKWPWKDSLTGGVLEQHRTDRDTLATHCVGR
jgi:hypothetical protein